MTEAAKAAQRAYKAEWRRRNPDKVKEQQRRYWERQAMKLAEKEQAAEKERKNDG